MLTKHIYYDNLKDFVDEQLCTVASKISEKKQLAETNKRHREKYDKINGWMEAGL